MYLKSIEVHGFKSFANKILFEFHNGITGIVGPNGSGKSNVADAVRWVLGEQRSKQLRSSSMQDVIFSGTENRKPLGLAYVAITLDNADHKLPVDYEEVTVSRRVYRSGESEYLINGTVCRLKDVQELFYDTGIGKEGYSIIGQGQIERIISGKPEERRELFDEAAGIVKFKRRKNASQKKLEQEEADLVRVNDIILELEKQLVPLKRQSENARLYLSKRDELKENEIGLFLNDVEENEKKSEKNKNDMEIVSADFDAAKTELEGLKKEYDFVEEKLAETEEALKENRALLEETKIASQKGEGERLLLLERKKHALVMKEQKSKRLLQLKKEIRERTIKKEEAVSQKEELQKKISEIEQEWKRQQESADEQSDELSMEKERLEQYRKDVLSLLNDKASTTGKLQKYNTMLEQAQIKRAELVQRLLSSKSEEAEAEEKKKALQKTCEVIGTQMTALQLKRQENAEKLRQLSDEESVKRQQVDALNIRYHEERSRYESLRNLAERYDGYGNSIRRVMELKSKEPGLIGVVADIIKTEEAYELAIETALGGSIQNIVTQEEETAKRMIGFLKRYRYGRATFLPLTSVGVGGEFRQQEALREHGVVGLANTLVFTKTEYENIARHLLGRTLVVDTIQNALKIAKKYRYSLRMVTLEGELLSPGGSLTGGAFKNASNLLGRRREMEEVSGHLEEMKRQLIKEKEILENFAEKKSVLEGKRDLFSKDQQSLILKQNTAKLNLEEAVRIQKEIAQKSSVCLQESAQVEKQIRQIETSRELIGLEEQGFDEKKQDLEAKMEELETEIQKKEQVSSKKQQELTELQLKKASIEADLQFSGQSEERLKLEIAQLMEERSRTEREAEEQERAANECDQKEMTLKEEGDRRKQEEGRLKSLLQELEQEKEECSKKHKSFVADRERLSSRMNHLDKELFRLNTEGNRLKEEREQRQNYMWEEYEITFHYAMELVKKTELSPAELKKRVSALKEEIKKLGNVNVNAIEDYREISERYEFLTSQRSDLLEAKKVLLDIIDELDKGMRKQFMEKFEEIQREFDQVFKQLFGGGKGSLLLVEGEDILETGIRIIAQPPGKKLQNMMQMSGGEKSLTAISLLFAIQNLKPSPFCLLDEIEAALDDSNVDRFAKYLHRLTKNTQFIVITHRRGTMESADRLYGITMEEKGISTLVSVDLIESSLEETQN